MYNSSQLTTIQGTTYLEHGIYVDSAQARIGGREYSGETPEDVRRQGFVRMMKMNGAAENFLSAAL
jgi:hypothetical protein